MNFCVLASGSSGNASVVRRGGFGMLIDLGVPPRRLERLLEEVGLDWGDIHAAVLTHPHSDHCNAATARRLGELGIPLLCHARHVEERAQPDSPFVELDDAGLLRTFELNRPFSAAALAASAAEPLDPGLSLIAFALPHDCGLNCGFRITAPDPETRRDVSLGYASDLGSWDNDIVQRLRGVDILALEFNHDETMQRESGRPAYLIQRVLSARGHLSNRQAAALVAALLRHARPASLTHLVQLHLSRQCNTPDAALEAARAAVGRRAVRIHTAHPERPSSWISPQFAVRAAAGEFRQALLPGWA